MIHTHSSAVSSEGVIPALGEVRNHLAEAMVGKAVDLLTRAHTVRHGIVTGVICEGGNPKIIVGGRRYDVSQVLTILPASLN